MFTCYSAFDLICMYTCSSNDPKCLRLDCSCVLISGLRVYGSMETYDDSFLSMVSPSPTYAQGFGKLLLPTCLWNRTHRRFECHIQWLTGSEHLIME